MNMYCKFEATNSDIRRHYCEAISDAYMIYLIIYGISIALPYIGACGMYSFFNDVTFKQSITMIAILFGGIIIAAYPDVKALCLSKGKTPHELIRYLYGNESDLMFCDKYLILAYFASVHDGQTVTVQEDVVYIDGTPVRLPEHDNKYLAQLIIGENVVLE